MPVSVRLQNERVLVRLESRSTHCPSPTDALVDVCAYGKVGYGAMVIDVPPEPRLTVLPAHVAEERSLHSPYTVSSVAQWRVQLCTLLLPYTLPPTRCKPPHACCSCGSTALHCMPSTVTSDSVGGLRATSEALLSVRTASWASVTTSPLSAQQLALSAAYG